MTEGAVAEGPAPKEMADKFSNKVPQKNGTAEDKARVKWGRAELYAEAGEVELYDMLESSKYRDEVIQVPLRRLTEGEWRKIEKQQSRGVQMMGAPDQDAQNRMENVHGGMQMKIDIAENQAGEALGRQMAVAYCFNGGGELTVEDVEGIPNPGLVGEMSEKIYEISGVQRQTQEDIKSVRENGGRGADSAHESDGVSPGE